MKHWREDDFERWLYGLADDSAHLDECAGCRAIADRVAERRRQAIHPPEVSAEFLAAQRRNIYARLGTAPHSGARLRWALSLASAVLLAILSISLLLPGKSNTPLYSPADEQLFSDLAQIEQSSEPRAIKPIHNLFEQ